MTELNSNVHWLVCCISFGSTNSDKQHSAEILIYNIANFDVLKLPVLEVRFYTARSGGVASVLDAITHMSCLSWPHHQ